MYSEKLKAIRKKLKLSQEEMAFQTGTSYRAYSSYERGDRKPPFEFLEKLVLQFDVNLNSLIADRGELFILDEYYNQAFKMKNEILDEVRKMLINEGIIK